MGGVSHTGDDGNNGSNESNGKCEPYDGCFFR